MGLKIFENIFPTRPALKFIILGREPIRYTKPAIHLKRSV